MLGIPGTEGIPKKCQKGWEVQILKQLLYLLRGSFFKKKQIFCQTKFSLYSYEQQRESISHPRKSKPLVNQDYHWDKLYASECTKNLKTEQHSNEADSFRIPYSSKIFMLKLKHWRHFKAIIYYSIRHWRCSPWTNLTMVTRNEVLELIGSVV